MKGKKECNRSDVQLGRGEIEAVGVLPLQRANWGRFCVGGRSSQRLKAREREARDRWSESTEQSLSGIWWVR